MEFERNLYHGTIKVLLLALLEIKDIISLDSSLVELYDDILKYLYPLNTTTLLHNGEEIKLLSVGTKWNGESVEYCEGDYPFSPFPASELSVVYPTGLVSLAQKESKLFELASNTARVIFDYDVYGKSKMGTSGHAVMPQVAARLGMRGDCLNILNKYVADYQVFSNGLTHFADIRTGQFWEDTFHPRIITDENTTNWETLHEKSTGTRVEISSENFLHCYFESASNIMTGINEMMLQSFDSVIRLFPATPKNYTAIFTLLAINDFLVTSEINHGTIRYVVIQSNIGGRCKIYLPWDEAPIAVTCDKKPVLFEICNGIVSFDTIQGEKYLVTRSEYPLENYYKDKIECIENIAPKAFKRNTLGKQQIY
ncbi:MAG: hypothetical protein RR444_05365 [Oscillospiraceae bacterium]